MARLVDECGVGSAALELLIAPKALMMVNLLEIAICCWDGMIAGMVSNRTSSGLSVGDDKRGPLDTEGCSEGWSFGMMDYTGFMPQVLLMAYLLEMAIDCTCCWAEMLVWTIYVQTGSSLHLV